ncbi:unnamed protein product [Mycena citricolor]|uniref:Major facilitator superfamily (MFS) profile domain-containing protein n=1 Tax=Mycena citricolor TaxID=2018698 RepID=A0AAD2Q211_9AGAR|nr:unnamed protein product [Mycena citricolor]
MDASAQTSPTLTPRHSVDGLALKTASSVHEPSLDPRIALPDDPRAARLTSVQDAELGSVKSDVGKREEAIYLEFEPNDPRDPVCWPNSKKWVVTALACFSTLMAASSATAFTMGTASMTVKFPQRLKNRGLTDRHQRDLNCTEFQATVAFIVFPLGFSLVPLVSSSFSEEVGRQPIYIASAIGFTILYLPIALAKNIQTVTIARFLQGGFGSSWATMVGGTIADIWRPHERGLPMAIFSLASLGGTGLAPVVYGWVEMNSRLEWRWIEWIQMIYCGVYTVIVLLVMRETRSSILLVRLAQKVRKETGDHRYRARIEDEKIKLSTLIYISCTRPIHLLFTEPVVSSFSLWIGFLWGVMFCMIESIPGEFSNLHNFNIGQEGTVFLTLVIGASLGFLTNFYQEHLYRKYYSRRGPEARLICACAAAVVLPLAMFIYAWCSFPRIPWISLAIAVTLYIWATFMVYLAVFSYLADCYGPFASSALAGQSLCRNLLGTVFPLFTKHMFAVLGYTWANTMFALIATVMVPIPFVLFFYGPRIRARSRFSSIVMEQERLAAMEHEKV